ncbi:MAG: glycosyltransferase family 2 protein [Candidatus Sericytochromatia bacterium]|nr:glycosyltransferase family 2 protein [Candidatus Sericytochromatia bacterium]
MILIALNEGHNMEAVLENLAGWAQEVFLVDSYSQDETVDIALRHGVHVVQRRFRGFGDQWNFALKQLPIQAPWTLKLDPDERLTADLKDEICRATQREEADGYLVPIRLHFMTRALPVRLRLTRLWRTGRASFSAVAANEHARVNGYIESLAHDIEHHDSPDLHHWLEKQNNYTTAEAINSAGSQCFSDAPVLSGTRLQRRLWLKKHFMKLPGRYALLFMYHYLWLGAWRAGRVGYMWSRLRADVYRLWEYKLREIQLTGRLPQPRPRGPGAPDRRVESYD